MADFDGVDESLGASGRRDRVASIIRSHGDRLFLPPAMAKAEEEQRRQRIKAELERHDMAFIEPGDRAKARRLGLAWVGQGDEDPT